MKIVGVVGILDFPKSEDRVWKNLRIAFRKEFPEATFVVEHMLYFPWSRKKMKSFAEQILTKYDTGEEDLILFGYSLGGVIACSIAPQFKKSRVLLIGTLATPHRLVQIRTYPIPLCTFSGVFDPIVPWFLASQKGVPHHRLFSDHLLWMVFSSRPGRTIAHHMKELLPKPLPSV